MKPVPFQELERLALSLGWTFHHARGSHFVYRKAGAPAVSIPRHGSDVAPGTARNILRVLGVDPATFG